MTVQAQGEGSGAQVAAAPAEQQPAGGAAAEQSGVLPGFDLVGLLDDGAKVEQAKEGAESEVAAPTQGMEATVPDEEPEDELSALKQDMLQEDEGPVQGEFSGYKIKLPKGVTKDNELLGQFTALAAKTKASPELVQQSVELLKGYQEKFFGELAERDQKFRANINNQFIRQNKADPVYGGEHYEANCNKVMKVLRHLVPKDELLATVAKDGKMGMMEYLKASNSLNATPLWKLLIRAHDLISESPPAAVGSSGPDRQPKAIGDILFGGTT